LQLAGQSGGGQLLREVHKPRVTKRHRFTGHNRNVIPAKVGTSRASQGVCDAQGGPGFRYSRPRDDDERVPAAPG